MRRKFFQSSLLRHFQTLAAPPTNVSSSRPYSTTLFISRFGCHDRHLWSKCYSSVASQSLFFQDEKQGYFPSRYSDDAKQGRLVPVNAYFLSTRSISRFSIYVWLSVSCLLSLLHGFRFLDPNCSVDLKSLRAQNAFNLISLASRVSDCVILRFYDNNFKFESDPQVFDFDFSNESNCHYIVVFQYGSVVLFNVSEQKADGYLKIVENHALTKLSERTKDDYSVVEIPTLKTWMKGGLDHIMLKSLSVDGIHTIASVLGQSIALDYFIRQVDVMVELFSNINQEMEKTGHFRLKNKMLLQLVGKANSILEAVILKLKLFDRPEIAWKNANYAQIWEYLRDDFELTNRFGSLHFKLEFVERNIAFFRNILQNRKMRFQDSLIVILLIVEIFMSIYRNGI